MSELNPPPAIAMEISGNHAGDLGYCLSLIEHVQRLGGIPKFQSFDPKKLAKKRLSNPWVEDALGHKPELGELRSLYTRTETPKGWWTRLLPELEGRPWCCSVFSIDDLEFMLTNKCPALKVASFELRDLELIDACAQTQLPMVMSVNHQATVSDISDAIDAAEDSPDLTILYATRYYNRPCTQAEFDLEVESMRSICDQVDPWCQWGLSDHTQGMAMAGIAITTGAALIEKHIKLQDVPTFDSPFSFTPEQMKNLVKMAREAQ